MLLPRLGAPAHRTSRPIQLAPIRALAIPNLTQASSLGVADSGGEGGYLLLAGIIAFIFWRWLRDDSDDPSPLQWRNRSTGEAIQTKGELRDYQQTPAWNEDVLDLADELEAKGLALRKKRIKTLRTQIKRQRTLAENRWRLPDYTWTRSLDVYKSAWRTDELNWKHCESGRDNTAKIRSLEEELEELMRLTGGDGESVLSADVRMDGHAFEHWTANQLHRHGWSAEVTRGSGDQGVDVIAEKNGRRIGIQCKRWKANVGNKAVQEIFAGVQYFDLDHGCIVVTSGYTQSARALGHRLGVTLLHERDLPRLEEILGQQ